MEMPKATTHFEQVPLAMVKRIIEEENKREAAAEQARIIAKDRLERELLEANTQ